MKSKEINLTRHVWEGWTIQSFIDELEPNFNLIMSNNSWRKPFTSREELKWWCMENQPYYKKYIPEIVDYFWNKINLTN